MAPADHAGALGLVADGDDPTVLPFDGRVAAALLEAIVLLPVDRGARRQPVEPPGAPAVVAHVAEIEPLRLELAAVPAVAPEQTVVAVDPELLLVEVHGPQRGVLAGVERSRHVRAGLREVGVGQLRVLRR